MITLLTTTWRFRRPSGFGDSSIFRLGMRARTPGSSAAAWVFACTNTSGALGASCTRFRVS